MLWVAKKMCYFLAKYQSIIVALHPTNSALIAALAAANVACSTLANELEAVREYGV